MEERWTRGVSGMFLVIISHLPRDYNFYCSHQNRLKDVLKILRLKEDNVELLIFKHYEDADDATYDFDNMEVWDEQYNTFQRINLRCVSLCMKVEE